MKKITLLMAFAILALTNWQAWAQTTLSATHDAYVRDGSNVNNTYGTSDPNNLAAKKSNVVNDGFSRNTYLKFDISGIVTSIGNAKLRLYGALNDNTGSNLITAVYSCSDITWTESSITWNNKPVSNTTSLAAVNVVNATAQYYEWDVTSYIAAQKTAGATSITLVLINSSVTNGPYTRFNSDEASSNKPQLVVTATTGGGGGTGYTNIATYAGSTGKETFNDVVQLSDGTYLVAGAADDLNWINVSVPRTQLTATGINNGTGTNKIGFLLHLSSNLQTINRVVYFGVNAVEDIKFIKTSNVPGAATGNIYISGTTNDTQANNGGYFIARLNNNFVSGAPTALTWGKSIYAVTGSYIRDNQPWDVGSDNKVTYLTGETHGYNWCAAYRLNASAVLEIVPEWRSHWSAGNVEFKGTAASYTNGARDPLSYSAIVFKRSGRGDLRSWTQADYDLWQPDGNGGTKKGKWPLDILFSGPFNTVSPNDNGPGYTGYNCSSIFTYGPSTLAIDRRDNSFYIGMNMKSVLPGGNPDFEPAVVAYTSTGGLNWWSRLYHEKTPAGVLQTSTPDQYVDGLAIDYTNTPANGGILVVNGRCHGNNTENLWEGNTITAVPGAIGFKNQFTGSNGNIHISWLGKLRLDNGQLNASSYVAEANEGNTSWGTPLADPNLDAWFNPNGGWTELNSTRLRPNSVKINNLGSVLITGSGRRTITTAGAFEKMIKPSAGQSSWNSFVRAYKKDLSNLAYSGLVTGTWDSATGAGGDNITINNLFPVSNGVIAVGVHKEGSTAGLASGNNMPTSSVPTWGSATASGQSAVLVFYSSSTFFNPGGGTYRQGTDKEDDQALNNNKLASESIAVGLVEVYPNPATSSIYCRFKMPDVTNAEVSLIDAAGRVMSKQYPTAAQTSMGIKFETSDITPGIYLLRINAGGNLITKRVSVTK